ncbi:hypothetical protein THAPSDRAFT_42660 [Thalassiosira pseudonana CCMP1335]|uniref:AB hydrolase-1 domain-containing protein n=1 Tax=Thalassiosira pseudonana TaxID=35128 RepID=B8CE51_THAPS|nr:hypothetical protein THAPSDRAFT_42660 [Thalassiosira pseudonana CCMP1335]EED88319.1 hypothetical protein THAPSDRAFT_42660 [Thalassiosira pseudonana CCMP1335]
MPSHSPATKLPNQIYKWRNHNIRYQVSGPENADHTLLLVHGLFVNSDHWRRMLTGLNNNNGGDEKKTYRVYALDLLGSGWSDKPNRNEMRAKLADGENGRFLDCDSVPYNFYTWAEQLTDFCHDVIHADANGTSKPKVTLVANSIGTMSSLQSVLDEPNLFNGVFVINPNFRELHMAEVPLSPLTMPLVRQIQSLLRSNGHGLFKSLATPSTVTAILKEPYKVTEAIDEELVSVLLDPLLTKGADDVVFDTLSYSAGPLPEQQLSSPIFPKESCPVWVAYGKDDPWTPEQRVEKLKTIGRPQDKLGESTVERIVGLEGVGHCPHDESPDVVNALLLEFLDRL